MMTVSLLPTIPCRVQYCIVQSSHSCLCLHMSLGLKYALLALTRRYWLSVQRMAQLMSSNVSVLGKEKMGLGRPGAVC